MSDAYLIQVAIGPVQGFIASARRSRDLWAGSALLSELARAVGKQLVDQGAELIYPTRKRVEAVEAGGAPIEQGNLSNQLLAKLRLSGGASIQDIAQALKQAARAELERQVDRTLADLTKEVPDAGTALDLVLWKQQCQEAMECFVAWAAFDGSDTDYGAALGRLKTCMAARKTTRDFAPWAATPNQPGRHGRFKSSLDGLAESVLLPPPKTGKTEVQQKLSRVLGLTPREELDMLGLAKRFQGRSERFTAFTRIAADPWIQRLHEKAPGDLARLKAPYEALIGSPFATRTAGNGGTYSAFPYDAALLYPERLSVAIQDASASNDKTSLDHLQALQALKKALIPIWKAHRQPSPYAAMLLADGDQMGAFIDSALGAQGHSAISSAIARVADDVPGITRKHRGHAIYAGGEDLMLLMPLPGVIGAARALAERLDQAIQVGVSNDLLKPDAKRPTLRVGAAICHVMDPYALLRERAQTAEQYAKHGDPGGTDARQRGNALGLRLHIRSGQTLQARLCFDDHAAFDRLAQWASAYRAEVGQLPGRVAFDTQHFGDQYQSQGIRYEVARSAYLRSLHRANERGGAQGVSKDLIKRLTDTLDQLSATQKDGYQALAQLGNELVLARWLSAQTQNDLGERA